MLISDCYAFNDVLRGLGREEMDKILEAASKRVFSDALGLAVGP